MQLRDGKLMGWCFILNHGEGRRQKNRVSYLAGTIIDTFNVHVFDVTRVEIVHVSIFLKIKIGN